MKIAGKYGLLWLSCIVMFASAWALPPGQASSASGAAASAQAPSALADRHYAPPELLDAKVMVKLGQAGLIQENAKGENEVYFHSNGLPGVLTVVDAETGERKHAEAIPRTEAVWAITAASDGNVYFAG